VGCLAVACQPGGGDSGGIHAQSKRFTFVRGKNQLLRIESATGRVWAVPENGDGGWVELKQAPGPDGEPETPGRYGLFSIVDRLNIAPNRLLLVDRATGRSWLREASGGRVWNRVGDAGDAADEEAPLPPAPAPKREASRPPAPQADKLPVVSRAVLNASGGDDPQKIKVVVEAVDLWMVQHQVYLDHLVVMEMVLRLVLVVQVLEDGLLVVQEQWEVLEIWELLITGIMEYLDRLQHMEQELDLVLVEVLLMEISIQMVVKTIQLEVVV